MSARWQRVSPHPEGERPLLTVSSSPPVIPLNIGLLTIFGRKLSLGILQLLAAVFFMLLNICTTM